MLVEVNSGHGGDGMDMKWNRSWVKAVIEDPGIIDVHVGSLDC